jgi:hypothetical protein
LDSSPARPRGTCATAKVVTPRHSIGCPRLNRAVENIDAIVRQERKGKGALASVGLGKLGPQEAGLAFSALRDVNRDRADITVVGRDVLEDAARLGIKLRAKVTSRSVPDAHRRVR